MEYNITHELKYADLNFVADKAKEWTEFNYEETKEDLGYVLTLQKGNEDPEQQFISTEKPVKKNKPPMKQLTLKKFEKRRWNLFGQRFEMKDQYGETVCQYYSNIFDNPKLVEACFCPGYIEILEFRLHKKQVIRNRKGPDYYGWIDTNDGSLDSVWASLCQCKIGGMPSDYKEKEKLGLGVLVRLAVKSIDIIKNESPVKKLPVKKEEKKFSAPPIRKIIW